MSLPKLPPAPVHTTELQRANRARMLQFLREECQPEEFWFGEVVAEKDTTGLCGTVCCAVGWTPKLFPEQARWVRAWVSLRVETDASQTYYGVAAELFGLSPKVAEDAFLPDSGFPQLAPRNRRLKLPPADCEATPQQVADRLEFAFALYP